MTKSVVSTLERIEREAVANKVAETRTIHSLAVGKVVRQGDIYVHRVDAKHAHGRALTDRQLAVGVTQGSRHVAESPAKVFEGMTAPEWCQPGALLGPCVVSRKRFTISHPEHAHLSLPAGTWQVTHQRDARTGGGVQD